MKQNENGQHDAKKSMENELNPNEEVQQSDVNLEDVDLLNVASNILPVQANRYAVGTKARYFSIMSTHDIYMNQLRCLDYPNSEIALYANLVPTYNEYLGTNTTRGKWGAIWAKVVNYESLSASSDIRKKNVIADYNTTILDKIDDINVFYYTFKEDETAKKRVGISAQEIKEILPEVVNEAEDGTLGVDYANMAAVLSIQAIKELKAEITQLKERIQELESK